MRLPAIAILAAAFLAPRLARAEHPATQPHDTAHPHRPMTERPERGGAADHPDRPDREWPKPQQSFTQEDWEKAAKYFEQTSPNRWASLQKNKDWSTQPLKHMVVNRWRAMEWLGKEDPELYQNKTQQVAEEDKVFGLINALPKGEPTSEVRTQLQDHIRGLLTLRLAERKLKIDRIRQLLQAEQTRLQAEQERVQKDEERTDQLVSEYTQKSITDHDTDWLRPAPTPRHPGGREWPTENHSPTTAP